MRKKLKRIILTILFAGILGICILQLNRVFEHTTRYTLTEEFFDFSDGQIDVVFAGPSTTMEDIYPMKLWRDYGITAYNLGVSNQSLSESYYVLKAAIEQVHPKLIVVDGGTVFDTKAVRSLETIHWLADKMPVFSRERWEMMLDLAGDDLLQLIFPLDIYHSKWKDPRNMDLGNNDYEKHSALGTYVTFQNAYSTEFEETEIDTSYELHGWVQIYLEKLVELSEETGTELLFVTYPTFGDGTYISEAKYINRLNASYALSRWTRERGLTHINYFTQCEELGFDREQDSVDGHHMNYYGGQKVTALVGEYITSVYDLEDHRGDEAYSFMKEFEENYDRYIFKRGLKTVNSYANYFRLLSEYGNDSRYTIFLALGGKNGRSFTAEDVRSLASIGPEQNLVNFGTYSYAAIISGGTVLYESDGRSRSLEETRTEEIYGKTCVVTSSVNSSSSKALITIDGTNYALNRNGLNIVVYDHETEMTVSAITFEMNGGSSKYYR